MRNAKEDGQKVTAEVCPHHFTLTSADIKEGNSNFKMNPPLRTKEDVEALKRGLKDDVFDVISTDHAPHRHSEKSGSMRDAPFGIVGLETCVALTISELVKPGVITPMQMAEKMSYNPAKILKLGTEGLLQWEKRRMSSSSIRMQNIPSMLAHLYQGAKTHHFRDAE